MKRGDLSEDGDAWIDKHSGYKIKNIEANTDEGYDQSGFKSISREALTRDEEDILLEEIEVFDDKNVADKYERSIKNIFKSLKSKMNISFNTDEAEKMCYNQVKSNVSKYDELIKKKQDENKIL